MRSLLIISFVLFFTVSITESSIADVLIQDIRVEAVRDFGGLTSGQIETAAGAGGNFELLVCGIDTDAANPFNVPTPGAWEEINNSECFEPGCQLGVWGRIAGPGGEENLTCSWGNESISFLAASLRFKNVDQENPIIDSACTEVVDDNVVLEPVSSEPGAQLVSLFINRFESSISGGGTITENEFNVFNSEFVAAADIGGETVVALSGGSELDVNGEGFEGAVIPVNGFNQPSVLCILSIRMQTETIPTMSEWGFLAVAVFMGAAGVWYLRRKQAA